MVNSANIYVGNTAGYTTISESFFLRVRDAAIYHGDNGGWRQDELGLAVSAPHASR